jgi:hypothetical protein
VVPQDTTEVNFSGRDKHRKGLGPASNGKTPGFFTHAAIAVDVADEAAIGPVSAQIWTRETAEAADYAKRAFADKESARWLKGAESAAAVLDGAEEIIVVGGRESGIYPVFARKPERVHFVVRAARDRKLSCGGPMFEAAASWPVLGEQIVDVAPKGIGDKGRVAKVLIEAGTATVNRPAPGMQQNRSQNADPDPG